MTEQEIEQFELLTQKILAANFTIPNMPQRLWKACHSFIGLCAVEVLIVNPAGEVLLFYRKDHDWDGWEIPGGFVEFGKSIPETCMNVARREVGLSIQFDRVIHAFAHPENPRGGHPISIVCLCYQANPAETPSAGTFFATIPEPMVLYHTDFLQYYFDQR